jgi:hypothetical protein
MISQPIIQLLTFIPVGLSSDAYLSSFFTLCCPGSFRIAADNQDMVEAELEIQDDNRLFNCIVTFHNQSHDM